MPWHFSESGANVLTGPSAGPHPRCRSSSSARLKWRKAKEIHKVSEKTISLLDRLLAIPVIVYFWWYEWRRKRGDTEKES
jgi:hypothetical protein